MKASIRRQSGFTLLEVILAIGVLAFGLAMLSEGLRLAMMNGRAARDLTTAQLLAESKMSELAAGAIVLTSLQGGFEEPFADWVYSVECTGTDMSDFLAVRVTVSQDPLLVREPFEFTLSRWMADPGVDLSASLESKAAAEAAANSSSSSSTTNSTGTNGTATAK